MYVFPSDLQRRKKWIINCRRDRWIANANSRLCETYFENSQFEQKRMDGLRKLKPNAVPTLLKKAAAKNESCAIESKVSVCGKSPSQNLLPEDQMKYYYEENEEQQIEINQLKSQLQQMAEKLQKQNRLHNQNICKFKNQLKPKEIYMKLFLMKIRLSLWL